MKSFFRKIPGPPLIIVIILLAAAVLLACGPASQSNPGPEPGSPAVSKDDVATPTPKPGENVKYPNLSPLLLELAVLDEADELTEEQIAVKALMYHGPQVFVDIDILNDIREDLGASLLRGALNKWLENEGAFPKYLGPEYRPPYIYAWVKVSDLGALSQQPGVTAVTELQDKDGSFAKMVADGNAVLYLPIWVKDDPYERLDQQLAELLHRYKAGELTAEQVAKEYQDRTDGAVSLNIALMADQANTQAIAGWLKEESVVLRLVYSDDEYKHDISANVPVSLLDTLAGQSGIYAITSTVHGFRIAGDRIDPSDEGRFQPFQTNPSATPTPTPEPTPTPVVSQGVIAHGANAWAPSYTGNGVKVGVIDSEFAGFSDMPQVERPLDTKVFARCYTSADALRYTVDIADCGDTLSYPNNNKHGTQAAQAIIDVAPDVTLYISKGSLGPADATARQRLLDVIEWMVREGVDIINYSIGWPLSEGLGDGVPRLDNSLLDSIDTAVANDILWVNAASNHNYRIWHGRFSDTTSPTDGYHDFSSGDDRNYIPGYHLGDGPLLIQGELRWDEDWESADCDMDLELHWASTTTTETAMVSGGRNTQCQGRRQNVPLGLLTFCKNVLANRPA